jgi:hypothetical protein
MLVVEQRCRTEPNVVHEMLEESSNTTFKGRTRPSTTSTAKSGNDESQHLLDGIASLARDLLARLRRRAPHSVLLRPLRDERIDHRGESFDAHRSTLARKFAELNKNGYAAENIASRIALLSKRRHVLLDGAADPRRPDPVDRSGTNEEPLQHDNLHAHLAHRVRWSSSPSALCGKWTHALDAVELRRHVTGSGT